MCEPKSVCVGGGAETSFCPPPPRKVGERAPPSAPPVPTPMYNSIYSPWSDGNHRTILYLLVLVPLLLASYQHLALGRGVGGGGCVQKQDV